MTHHPNYSFWGMTSVQQHQWMLQFLPLECCRVEYMCPWSLCQTTKGHIILPLTVSGCSMDVWRFWVFTAWIVANRSLSFDFASDDDACDSTTVVKTGLEVDKSVWAFFFVCLASIRCLLLTSLGFPWSPPCSTSLWFRLCCDALEGLSFSSCEQSQLSDACLSFTAIH